MIKHLEADDLRSRVVQYAEAALGTGRKPSQGSAGEVIQMRTARVPGRRGGWEP